MPRHPFRPAAEPLELRDVPAFFGNQLFPDDNPWNQDVSAAPVAANSDAIINRIVARRGPASQPASRIGCHGWWTGR